MSSKPKPKEKRRPGRPLRKSPPKQADKVNSLSDLAGILGVSYETCRKAQNDGDLVVNPDGTIDVAQAREAMAERALRGKGGVSSASSEAKHWDTEWRKAKAIREQILVKEKLGTLVEKDEVIRAQVERELAFKHVIMALPKRLSALLVGKGRLEIESLLTQACTDALRHLATGG